MGDRRTLQISAGALLIDDAVDFGDEVELGTDAGLVCGVAAIASNGDNHSVLLSSSQFLFHVQKKKMRRRCYAQHSLKCQLRRYRRGSCTRAVPEPRSMRCQRGRALCYWC